MREVCCFGNATLTVRSGLDQSACGAVHSSVSGHGMNVNVYCF